MITLEQGEFDQLRRSLLLLDREKTRLVAKRKLERIAKNHHPLMAPIALGGLATGALWDGDYNQAISHLQTMIAQYSSHPVALWAATLLSSIFRSMGMKRERFEVEGERFRIMRRIALQSESSDHKIFALQELLQELRARDLESDADRCAAELQDLLAN